MDGNNNNNKKNGKDDDDDDKKKKTSSLSQLEQDIEAKNRGRASAASAASNAVPSLSQLERDLAAKQTGRAARSSASSAMARPGAMAVGPGSAPSTAPSTGPGPSTASSSLTQLEQDIAAKTRARKPPPTAAHELPQQQHQHQPQVPLTQLEQDIAAKQSARGGGASAPSGSATRPGAVHSSGLSQLEQDIAAKASSSSSSAAYNTNNNSNYNSNSNNNTSLSRLEQDIAAKNRAGSSSSAPASRPGAVASGGNGTLTQLERDIAAKSSGMLGMPSAHNGNSNYNNHSNYNSNNNYGNNNATSSSSASPLTQLELDVLAKSQARAGATGAAASAVPAAASRPGAVASNGLTQLERDIVQKTAAAGGAGTAAAASRPGATASAGLTQLELDIVQKTSAAGAARGEGASAQGSNTLSQLESDIMAKARAGGGGNGTVAGNRKPPPSYAMSNNTNTTNNNSSHARDADIKQAASMGRSGSGRGVVGFNPNRTALSNLESEILRKNGVSPRPSAETDAAMPSPLHYQQQQHRQPPVYYPPYNPYDNDGNGNDDPYHLPMDNVPLGDDDPYNNNGINGNSNIGIIHTRSSTSMYDPRPEEAPAVRQTGDSPMGGGEEDGGIEAFVAEPNVVDAEVVLVIRTDEEEEVEAKKRQKKFLTYLMLAGVVLLTIVIVPVAVTTRKKTAATPTPTLSPTISPTMAPTMQIVPQLALDLAARVVDTDLDVLRKRGTPQNEAMLWMASEDTFSIEKGWDVQSERYLQRFVLAVIYFALNGDKWANCGRSDSLCTVNNEDVSWLTNADECDWIMIDCDDNDRVIAITNEGATRLFDAHDVKGYGKMPPEIAHLTFLEKIHLTAIGANEKANYGGPLLSYLSKLTNLRTLDLHDAAFSGTIPSDFAATHPVLTTLDLNRNAMSGPIPSLNGLGALRELNLFANKFAGTIPSDVGSLQALTSLDLRMNELSGEVPSSLYTLTKLNSLDLEQNAIKGTIANEIGNLANLTKVSLGRSNVMGTLPPGLFSLTALTELSVPNAQFSGPLREEDFAQIAGTIRILDLADNDFSGPIPINAWEATERLEELYLYENPKLEGTVTQTFCIKRGLVEGQVKEMQIGCNVICVEGCCHPVSDDGKVAECGAWPTSTSDLPE